MESRRWITRQKLPDRQKADPNDEEDGAGPVRHLGHRQLIILSGRGGRRGHFAGKERIVPAEFAGPATDPSMDPS